MLGAQALRTKQKAEQKEKEKKHRDRLKSLEIQREKLHKQACELNSSNTELENEEAARQYLESMEISGNPPIKLKDGSSLGVTVQHRHSVHTTNVNHLTPHVHSKHLPPLGVPPQRSPSSDYCKEKKEGGSRLMKWLGLASTSDEKEQKLLKKRRMSTFT